MEYRWKLEFLNEIRKELLQEGDTFTTKIVTEMMLLSEGQSIIEDYSFMNRVANLFHNICYQTFYTRSEQRKYLKRLQEILSRELLECEELLEESFSLEYLMSLFEEFIEWLPCQAIQKVLQGYYQEKFQDYFYFCEKKALFKEWGITYSVDGYPPFSIIQRRSFLDTFMTLVHEMGHVSMNLLWGNHYHDDVSVLFSEIEGLYFEQLGLEFLKQKNLHTEVCSRERLNNYCSLQNDVLSFQFKNIKKCAFTMEDFQAKWTQIYSTLGTLELWNAFQGDLEHQLDQLMTIIQLRRPNINSFLTDANFKWRENDFELVKQYRRECQVGLGTKR